MSFIAENTLSLFRKISSCRRMFKFYINEEGTSLISYITYPLTEQDMFHAGRREYKPLKPTKAYVALITRG
jgi:hypothetical protein